jgi:GAF domain-containing protein
VAVRLSNVLTYKGAKALSSILRISVAGIISYLILNALFTRLSVHLSILSGIAIGAVSIVVWKANEILFRHFIHPFVRRVYFRDFYDSRVLLSELRNSLNGVLDLQAIADIVSCKVQETFDTTNVAFFVRDEAAGNFIGLYSVGLDKDFTERELNERLIVSEHAFGLAALSKELYPLIIISEDYNSGWKCTPRPKSAEFSIGQNHFLQNVKYLAWLAWAMCKYILGVEVSDLLQDARRAKIDFNPTEAGILREIRAAALITVRISNELFGFMSLGKRRSSLPLSSDDQQVLSYMAVCAADAIKGTTGLNAFINFLGAWERVIKSPNLEDALQATLSAAIASITSAEAGSLFLWDSVSRKLVLKAQSGLSKELVDHISFSPGEGYAGWVFVKRVPIAIPDIAVDKRTMPLHVTDREKYNAALCVPLEAHGFRLGVLCLDGKSDSRPFEEGDVERLSTFAHQAALALFNSRLNGELYDLTLAINEGRLDLTGIFEAVAGSIFRLTESQSANLFLLRDPHNPLLSLALDPLVSAAIGLDLGHDETIKPRSRGMTYSAIERGEPCWVNNPSEKPGLNPASIEKGVRASVGLPLIVDKLVNGVLFINYHEEHSFADAEIRALVLFANQAAFALNNARQRHELALTDNVAWMGLLFPSMAHRIIQRTGSIALNVLGLRKILGDRRQAIPFLDGIDGSVVGLNELRSEALALPHDHQRTRVNLSQVVRSEILKWCESDSTINVTFTFGEDDCFVKVDPRRFGLVLEVLAINAIKSMRGLSEKSFGVSSEIRPPWVIINFTNNGKPIPEGLAKRLFEERIIQTGPGDGGSGVGLLISRRIIRRYGGELELKKSDFSGTTLSIWLPHENSN